MIGKVIEGRYTGASINKLPNKKVIFIETKAGERIALSKKNAIAIDDVTDQYPSNGRKVMMVMWNDYETSILQFKVGSNGTASQTTNSKGEAVQEKISKPSIPSAKKSALPEGKYCKMHSIRCINDTYCCACGHNLTDSETYIVGDDKEVQLKNSEKNKKSIQLSPKAFVGLAVKLTIFILCVGIIVFIVSNSTISFGTPEEETEPQVNRMDLFNRLYDTIVQKDTDLSYAERRILIDSYAVDAGLDLNSEDPFSKAFIDEYIANNSVEIFIQKLYTIYDDGYYNWDCCEIEGELQCEYQKFNDMLMYALSLNGIKPTAITLPPEGSAGFYADYPELLPETTVKETSGKFYTSSGENSHYESRENLTTGTAYGDFATMREEGHSYDEGRYEWKDGVFYDELPSWNYYNNTFYYYKGEGLGKIQPSSTLYFILEDRTYFLLSPTSCRGDNHTKQEWEMVCIDEEAIKKTHEQYIEAQLEREQQINAVKNSAISEIRTLIPNALEEFDLAELYDAVNEGIASDCLSVTYTYESNEGLGFRIEAVYRVDLGEEYIDVECKLIGVLGEDTFWMEILDISRQENE